jgi:uncharacterized membrane protein YgaE (UPF0421/DUF939 family)
MGTRQIWRTGAIRALLRSLALMVAIIAILTFYRVLDLPAESWAVISAMLVLHTQAKASFRLALIRVAANVVGACVALLALHLDGSAIPAIAIALLLVGLICHLAYLDDGLRSAYVSVAIVMAADKFVTFSPPLDRIGSVTFGSLVGAGVSLLTERVESWWATRMAQQTADTNG